MNSKDIQTAQSKVNDLLKSDNYCVSENSEDMLRNEVERLRIHRDTLYKEVYENKSHQLYNAFCEANRKYLSAVRSLPPASPELQMKAITAFNSDKRFSITE